MAEKDKKFWMDTLSDFLNQENLFVDPSKLKEGLYILSSGEFGKIGLVKTVANIFEMFDTQIHDSYIGDLEEEAIAYNIALPEAIHGFDQDQWEYWVELRNALESRELEDPEGDLEWFFSHGDHDYEIDVIELITRHFEDFTIEEWLEGKTQEKVYRFGCSWQLYGHITVRAKNEEEALKKAKKLARVCPLPDDGEYLEDSFELDEENIEEAD